MEYLDCRSITSETRQRLLTAAPPPAKDTEQDLSIRVSYIYFVYCIYLHTAAMHTGSGQEVAVRAVYSRWRGSTSINYSCNYLHWSYSIIFYYKPYLFQYKSIKYQDIYIYIYICNQTTCLILYIYQCGYDQST